MDLASTQAARASGEPTPNSVLEALVRAELETAVYAERQGSKVYESLHNLNEVIGTQYGNRVLYELIQNAHDAHQASEQGKILIRLVVRSPAEGTLYVANGGTGFRKQNVEAIRNLATSDKEIGEGIGNKGLGFRSIEALTDDVRIYSQVTAKRSDRFDGYCFRFASASDIEDLLRSDAIETEIRQKVAQTLPTYLVPRALSEQPDDIVAFARSGYATVVVAPLESSQAVALATEQVQALADLEVPLLLFLDRIGEVRIEVQLPEQQPYRRVLRRRQTEIGDVPGSSQYRLYEVDVGEHRRFLVVRHAVDRKRVLEAVERSVPMAPQLKRWRNWKGEPMVSVAVGLGIGGATEGRLYNFLPMGGTALAPLMGYLDAPFFTDIDRRTADLKLPLNKTLMDAAAEACVVSALSIIEQRLAVSPQAVFDLIAWTGNEAGKLDDALRGAGSSLRDARIVPAIFVEGRDGWSSLSEVTLWPSGHFSVLRASDVARYVGAHLVSIDLDEQRIGRLKQVAMRTFRSLAPDGQRLAKWVEAFARSLVERKVGPRTWSRFYDDVSRVFEAAGADLDALAQKSILFDNSGKLRPAGGGSSSSQARVYVRGEAAKGRRSSAGVPLPPGTLSRRYRFLNERITLSPATLDAFVRAGLLRTYDPVDALAGLKSALGHNATDGRKQEALVWAFRVWQAAGARAEDALRDADLDVPTLSGWQPASTVAFSSSWTSIGRTLENYLVEAAEVSADCKRAWDRLLLGHQEWPGSLLDTKRQWIRFLEVIGVVDGLRPTPSRLTQKGYPAHLWDNLLRHGKPSEGLDDDWCAEVAHVLFNHPYTNYEMRGEPWRLPGQIEHDQLPETAREALCTLVLEHLRAHKDTFFRFDVGRFDRGYHREWDPRTLPTPLAAFIRSKPWIAASTREGVGFRRPDKCWAARVRRGGPPRFLDRVPESAADLVDSSEVADFAFSEAIGLRDWQSKLTAVDRLSDLAAISGDLVANDRPAFRREYQRAWLDVAETSASLPANLTLAVTRRGQLEALTGDTANPPAVIITQDAQSFEARVLSAAGRPVLEVGEVSTEHVARLMEATGSLKPLRLDGIGVQLLVDGHRFAPSATDPFLVSFGLEWLPEILVVGHELRGEQLERAILGSTIERRARAIRVRTCEQISLVVDGQEVPPTEDMSLYAFEHEELPTLIWVRALTLNWATLARTFSSPVSRLIDTRLRSAESLLLRLALDRQSEDLDVPSDDALARALRCDVQTVQDHRLALRTDLGRVLHLLLPVVAYYGGVDMARQLQVGADRAGMRFNALPWLVNHLAGCGHAPEKLLHTCEQARDRAEIRRLLDLDYGTFNQALVALGESTLSNEIELRQMYEAYLGRIRPGILDRLRRHHFEDFRSGRSLDIYVDRKTLAFLPFNPEWVLTREKLEQALVEGHVSRLLNEALGEDVSTGLLPLSRIVEANRKSLRSFAEEAMSVIRAWCRKHSTAIPTPWQNEEPQAIVRHVENKGLLDFDMIVPEDIPGLCHRADCWPDGMEETTERAALDLEQSDVDEEQKRRDHERKRVEIARRSIVFGGTSLDTGDAKFSDGLRQIAERWLSEDETWFERSRRRVKLSTFQNPESQPVGGGGKGKEQRKGDRQLTDAQRTAMGLASEWLAYQFLCRHHAEYVDEDCWISENRAHFFGGTEGDDSAGYDFLVKTPHVDWLYEAKSSLEDSCEFELTANELRVASSASKDGRRRYRILYVPYVFSIERWYVLELPNPMGERTRNQFKTVGRGSVRLRFERR